MYYVVFQDKKIAPEVREVDTLTDAMGVIEEHISVRFGVFTIAVFDSQGRIVEIR